MAILLILYGCQSLYDWVGGHFTGTPSEMVQNLSPEAANLIEKAFEGMDPARLADVHVHVVGLGAGDTGIRLNPQMETWWHPIKRFQYKIYLSASGIQDIDRADAQYMERLREQIQNIRNHGLYFLYAMDRFYLPDGTADHERTTVFVPNAYVCALAKEHPDLFVPVVSIHPYRRDALSELEHWARRGVRFIKWLPNAMGIDPSEHRVEPFYRKMIEFDMVLLSHTGRERAVEAEGAQHLGNPLLLRKPLDMGVTVVALHCASDGEEEDLDSRERERRSSFELFMRLMEDDRYEGRLFGEISAITFFNRLGTPLDTLLLRKDLHGRLLNGSDYPLPGVNFLIQTRQLAREGFIQPEERTLLNEIYGFNPLLFDFVVKRVVRHPETGAPFSPALFMLPQDLAAKARAFSRAMNLR
jgi:mannonate dehydratase